MHAGMFMSCCRALPPFKTSWHVAPGNLPDDKLTEAVVDEHAVAGLKPLCRLGT